MSNVFLQKLMCMVISVLPLTLPLSIFFVTHQYWLLPVPNFLFTDVMASLSSVQYLFSVLLVLQHNCLVCFYHSWSPSFLDLPSLLVIMLSFIITWSMVQHLLQSFGTNCDSSFIQHNVFDIVCILLNVHELSIMKFSFVGSTLSFTNSAHWLRFICYNAYVFLLFIGLKTTLSY